MMDEPSPLAKVLIVLAVIIGIIAVANAVGKSCEPYTGSRCGANR